MNLIEQSNIIYQDFINGDLSRKEFYEAYNALYSRIPVSDRQNLDRRIDRIGNQKGRCLGKFALSIYDSTYREKVLIERWVTMMLENGEFSELFIQDNGVDNSGSLLLDVNTGQADYEIYTEGGTLIPDGFHPLEIKFCPTLKKLTYKVGNLKNYLKSKSYLLTIISNKQLGGNGDPNHSGEINFDEDITSWCLIAPETIKKMLEEIEAKPYWEVGGKLALQLLEKDFNKYFEIRRFTNV